MIAGCSKRKISNWTNLPTFTNQFLSTLEINTQSYKPGVQDHYKITILLDEQQTNLNIRWSTAHSSLTTSAIAKFLSKTFNKKAATRPLFSIYSTKINMHMLPTLVITIINILNPPNASNASLNSKTSKTLVSIQTG